MLQISCGFWPDLKKDLQKLPVRGHGAGSSVQNMPNVLVRMWLLRTLDGKGSSASENIYVSASEGKPLPQAMCFFSMHTSKQWDREKLCSLHGRYLRSRWVDPQPTLILSSAFPDPLNRATLGCAVPSRAGHTAWYLMNPFLQEVVKDSSHTGDMFPGAIHCNLCSHGSGRSWGIVWLLAYQNTTHCLHGQCGI